MASANSMASGEIMAYQRNGVAYRKAAQWQHGISVRVSAGGSKSIGEKAAALSMRNNGNNESGITSAAIKMAAASKRNDLASRHRKWRNGGMEKRRIRWQAAWRHESEKRQLAALAK